MRIFKSIVQVLSTGYIFVYFSEHLFWSRVRPDDTLPGWFGAWIAYSMMAYIFLLLVSYFRVKDIWALFLAGAAFGWVGEGIVVQTAYEMLPLSISFTGLAWHALLTVWVGWYAVRRSILAEDHGTTLKLSLGLGLFYGLWAISWWLEPDGGVSSITQFAAFSFTVNGLVILAYWLADWSSTDFFIVNRSTVIFISILVLLYFCFITIPAAPIAIVLLPSLLGLVYWGLRENRLHQSEGSLLDTLRGSASSWKYLSLLGIPVTGTVVYGFASLLQLQWYTNWVLYLITTPLGFIIFGTSLYKLLHRKSIQASQTT